MRPPDDRSVGAIVVLSSAWFPPYPPLPTPILGTDTFERCAYAAWLHNHWQHVPVLASGGGSRGYMPYSLTMREVMAKQGVPEDSIWTEQKSTSTYENAAFSAAILKQHGVRRICLVTEAYHMARAEQCFRKQGIEVVPAACGFRIPLHWHASEFVPSWEAISWNEELLHELVGFAWYKARGRV
ncbi:MAG TPA: YdcF family protein [Bryobacteraceae bacterium]|nr:YdcF family protein [Bryobacteraceae bacterium]